MNIYNKSYSPQSSCINSNFKYFISTQKKWTGEAIPLKILIYVYDKNQENLYFKRITLVIKPHSRQANHRTQNQWCWATETVLASPAPSFLLPPHGPTSPFLYLDEQESSLRKRNEEKSNSKFKSWFLHKPSMWFNKYKETQHLCTVLLSKEGTDASNIIWKGLSLWTYVHWLNENYCIWEGTYLWFKA